VSSITGMAIDAAKGLHQGKALVGLLVDQSLPGSLAAT
jgi:hypothetical protein